MRISFAALMVLIGWFVTFAAMADSPPPPRPLEPKAFCTEQYQPVCGTKDGKRITYSNHCFADVDHATDISDGACSPSDDSSIRR